MLTRSQAARLNVKQDTKRVSIKPKKRGQPYFCSCTRKGTKRKMIKEEEKRNKPNGIKRNKNKTKDKAVL